MAYGHERRGRESRQDTPSPNMQKCDRFNVLRCAREHDMKSQSIRIREGLGYLASTSSNGTEPRADEPCPRPR
jgi:hypothetical protein